MPVDRARNLGLAFVVVGLIELSWGLFCIFGGGLLALMGFVDDEMGVVMWAGGAAYGALAAIQFPVAVLHLFTGMRLRAGKGGLILVIAALAICLLQLVFALYCFPFELALLIYGGVVLMDAEVRAHLDGQA